MPKVLVVRPMGSISRTVSAAYGMPMMRPVDGNNTPPIHFSSPQCSDPEHCWSVRSPPKFPNVETVRVMGSTSSTCAALRLPGHENVLGVFEVGLRHTHRGGVARNPIDLITAWTEHGTTPASARQMAPLRVRDAVCWVVCVGGALFAADSGIQCGHFDSDGERASD